jgi:uncharacterized protein (DUF2249 family)
LISPADNNPYLDVSQLEPPEPMTAILDALEKLPSGHFLYVYHRREPFPLYKLLQDMSMKWQTRCDDNGMFHIHIWPDGDVAAEEKALVNIL